MVQNRKIFLSILILAVFFCAKLATKVFALETDYFPATTVTGGWGNLVNASPSSCNEQPAEWKSGRSPVFYTNFNISLPSGIAIDGVELKGSFFAGGHGGYVNRIYAYLSGDNGASYTSVDHYVSPPLGNYATLLTGGGSDTWSRSWNETDFSNDNFQVKLDGYSTNNQNSLLADCLFAKISYHDSQPPTDPQTSFFSSSPLLTTWATDNTIEVFWPIASASGGATDNLSGVDGYSYQFTNQITTIPDAVKDLEENQTAATSSALTTGNNWYFHLRTVDNYGNWTNTIHYGPFYIDVDNPSVAITSPNNNQILRGNINVVANTSDIGSSINNVSFYYDPNGDFATKTQIGGNIGSGDAGGNYTSANFNTDSLAEGTVTLFAKAVDNVNQQATASSLIRIDRTNPVATISSPLSGSFVRGSITVSATATDNLEMKQVEFYRGLTSEINSASLIGTDTTASNNEYSFNYNTTAISDGNYYFFIKAIDQADNYQVKSVQVAIDNTAPASQITSLTNNAYYNSSSWPGVSGTASDSGSSASGINKTEVSIKRSGDNNYYNGTTWQNDELFNLATGTTTWSYSFTPSADAVYTITSKAADNAGNTESTAQVIITYDNTAPTNPTTATAYDSSSQNTVLTSNNWYNYEAPYFTWNSGSDNLAGISGYYVYYGTQITQTATGNFRTYQNFTAGSGSNIMTSGKTYYLRLRTQDNAGNQVDTSGFFVYKFDNNTPNDPSNFTYSHTIDTWSNDNTIAVSWTAPNDNPSNGSGVAGYSIDWDQTANTLPNTVVDLDSNVVTTSSAVLSDGKGHYFHLRTKDNAGNLTATIHGGPFNIDTTTPSIPSTPTTTASLINSTIPSWTWTASADSLSGLSYYHFFWDMISAGESNVASVSGTTTGYTHQTALTEGTWYAKVSAVDFAGNSATSSAASVTIDVTAPTVNSPTAGGTTTTDITPAWTWDKATDANDIDKYKIRIGTGDGTDNIISDVTLTSEGTSWTTTKDLEIGKTYYARLEAIDKAGNSASKTGKVTIVAKDVNLAAGAKGTISGDGASVEIPGGVFEQDMHINISKVGTQAVSTGNFSLLDQIYDFKAYQAIDGLTVTSFNNYVLLSINYSPDDLGGLSPSSLAIYYYDGLNWIALPSFVDTVNHRVYAWTNHFTYFAILSGVVTSPVITAISELPPSPSGQTLGTVTEKEKEEKIEVKENGNVAGEQFISPTPSIKTEILSRRWFLLLVLLFIIIIFLILKKPG